MPGRTATPARHPWRPVALVALVVVGALLTACGGNTDAAVVDDRGQGGTVATLPPTVTAPPTTRSVEVDVVATDAAPTTEDQAPAGTAGGEPTTSAAPTAVPDTTLPPTTVPPTTLPEAYTLLVPAPPMEQLVLAIGKQDGDGARVVQQRLLDLGFWLSGVDGDFGHTTTQALMAFQKYNRLPATGKVDQDTADALNLAPYRARGVSTQGDIIEVNKELQILFIIRGGQTVWTLNTSTGNGEPYEEEDQNTPGAIVRGVSLTPDGLFQVNRERPEGWWEGDLGKIYRPKYFNGGIAVHGSGSIPNYPASHGCVRVSVPAMDFIWEQNLMPLDSPVWVYGTV